MGPADNSCQCTGDVTASVGYIMFPTSRIFCSQRRVPRGGCVVPSESASSLPGTTVLSLAVDCLPTSHPPTRQNPSRTATSGSSVHSRLCLHPLERSHCHIVILEHDPNTGHLARTHQMSIISTIKSERNCTNREPYHDQWFVWIVFDRLVCTAKYPASMTAWKQ